MRPEEVIVEVRDKTLKRIGQIIPEDMDLKAKIIHCDVGSWSLTLPREHNMVDELWKPGSGVIITVRDEVFCSGPTSKPSSSASPEDPQGLITFSGVTDDILAFDSLTWPQPSNPDVSTQTKGHDIRSGLAETVMREYVTANIGPSAPAARRGTLAKKLVLSPNNLLGPTVSKSARFDVLGELLTEIAVYSNLGWRIVQRGANLVFEVYEIRDVSAFVRFDILNGTITDETIELSPPTVTRAIVAGQGDLEDRTIIGRTTGDAAAAEVAWGRQIEQFIDQRQTNEISELEQAAEEALIEGGFTGSSLKTVPSDDTTMRFPDQWRMGDITSVVIRAQEYPVLVTEVALVAGPEGAMIGAALGDVTGFNAETALGSRVNKVETRIAVLEKNTGVSRTAAGTISITAAAGATVSATIPFPVGRFKTAPVVTATPRDTAPGNSIVSLGAPTASGVTAYLKRETAGTTTIAWSAVETG